MLKVATLVTAMVISTAAFAVEQMQATDPVYGMEYCGANPQPNYCPEVTVDPNLARLMFDQQPVAEWDQTRARQWYWAHYRAQHPLTTADHEAAPIGLVGEPFPPGSEFPIAGIGSDYVAQAKADRAVKQAFDETASLGLPADCPQPTAERDAFYCNPDQQQANTAAIKEDALAAKDAAVLSAHAEAKPKRTRTRTH
jgi:hypothetical protein